MITMMATTSSSTMMGNNGVTDTLTAPPPLRNDHDYDGQGGRLFGHATFFNAKAKGRGGDCDDNKTMHQPTHMFTATNDRFLLASFPKAEGKEGDFEDGNNYDVRGGHSFAHGKGGVLTKTMTTTCGVVVCLPAHPWASMTL